MDKNLPPTLVCPIDYTPLCAAENAIVVRINRAIAAGRIKNRAGRLVDQPIDGALIREDKTLLYPIIDAIPVLLADEAIPLDQI